MSCSVTVIGEEEEVLPISVAHAIKVHGATDGPELRAQLQRLLEPAADYQPGGRPHEEYPK
jgi:hypothetical protein